MARRSARTNSYALVGSGGHASSIVAAAAAIGWAPWVVFERRGSAIATVIEFEPGSAVACIEETEAPPPADGWPVVVGLGVQPRLKDPGTAARRLVFERYAKAGWMPLTVVDPSAILRGTIVIGAGAQILAGAIVQPGSVIGDGVVINTGARVDHDCRIGAHAFVAPGAVLCGGVVLGEGALVGAGAVLLPGSIVPDGGLVPAGETFGRKGRSRMFGTPGSDPSSGRG
jgi:UDP-perosamine 4-acetyltransferase